MLFVSEHLIRYLLVLRNDSSESLCKFEVYSQGGDLLCQLGDFILAFLQYIAGDTVRKRNERL